MFKHENTSSFGHWNSEAFSNVSKIRTNGANLNGLLLFDQPSVVSAFRTQTAWTFSQLQIGTTWEGLFHEVIFYDRILSDSERSDVEDYLMDKWGVVDVVPEPEPETGLLAYYKFEPNQTAKLILDSSGNGHHVGLSGPLSATPLTSGVDGDALDLPGDNANYLSLPDYDASLKTIALWLKPDFTIQAGAPHLSLWDQGDYSGLVFNESTAYLNNETITLGYFPGNSYNTRHTATTASVPNGWFHLALSWNVAASHYDYFLDGEPIVTVAGTKGHVGLLSSATLKLGKIMHNNEVGSPTAAYDGAIDELRLYDISLTAAEIQALHAEVEAPIIRTTGEHNATVGTNFSLSLAADNGPTTYLAEGLPAGLSLNVVTGEISGTLSQPGYHRVFVKAMNEHGTGSSTIAIVARPQTDQNGWPVDVPDGSDIPQNGMVLWLDANDVDADGEFDTGTDHLKLASWADKAGKDHNATQATAFRQPEIRANQLPEHPGLNLLVFDGNQSLAFPTISQGRTFFWVVRKNPSSFVHAQFFSLEGTGTWGSQNQWRYFWTNNSSINEGVGRKNGEGFDIQENYTFGEGFQVLTLRTTDFVPADLIGKTGDTENYFTGNIGEILVYDRALSETEIETVEKYLGQKWGIAISHDDTPPTSGNPPTFQVTPANDSVTTAHLTEQILKYLKPEITAQPQSIAVANGGSTTLVVNAEGKFLTYQWSKDNQFIGGETNATIQLSGFNEAAHEGNYTVSVSNDFGTIVSDPALVTEQ
jgi:hypothetical protein